MSSHEAKALILKIAHAGELLGLAARKHYEVTAEVSEQAGATFIPQTTFLRFLRRESGGCRSGDAALDREPLRCA